MDKFEYKVRAEEIKSLIEKGDYAQAAEIADTIDWRRVKSVMMLCTISDLYKINRRYEDARDLLLLAYERRPGGRNICYSLCELSIKTGEFVQAMEYYKEFVNVAPKDPGRYILQYKLYEDQDVSLEERIDVLEELKKHDYREKWAYELAYLYHRVGLATRCVEECDEMILWFGDGDYVIKAMELKMLHQPLSPEQQEKYDHRFDAKPEEPEVPEETAEDLEAVQKETVTGDTIVYEPVREEDFRNYAEEKESAEAFEDQPEEELTEDPATESAAVQVEPAEEQDELNIHVKTMDVGQYNTINLQAELAQELKQLLDGETAEQVPVQEYEDADLDEPDPEETEEEPVQEEVESTEVFFGETGEIVMEQMRLEEAASARSIEKEMAVVEPPKEMAQVLSQEADGQISIVLPEKNNVEKQITGQMNIEEVLIEWERMKKENEEKRKEEVRQHVLQQTGSMFTEFEAAVRDGLLEKLEKGGTGDDTSAEETDAAAEEPVEEPQEAEAIEKTAEATVGEQEPAAEESSESDAEEADEVEELAEIEETVADEALTGTEDSAEVEKTADPERTGEVEELSEAEEIDEVEELAEIEETEETEELAGEQASESSDEVSEESEGTEKAGETIASDKAAEKTRSMTREEKELFGSYIQSRATKEQIVKAIDNISLAAYTGNVIITGEIDVDTTPLAKNIIREIQATDSNFSGKVAKISGQGLNRKNVDETLTQLQNGALIIQNACDMDAETVADLHKALQKESLGIVVLLQDDTKSMNKFIRQNELLLDVFTARVDVKALSNDMLVAYGRQYAKDQEFAIDELGMLALHNRIEQRQTIDHAVTMAEVKEIIDDAIRHASRKTPGHFFDILLAKRYDDEDMIIVTEKDFV